MIPITPGGLGFVEAGLSGVLTVAGATEMQANLTVVTYRLAATWLPCVVAAVALMWLQRRHRERRLAALLVTPPDPSPNSAAAPRTTDNASCRRLDPPRAPTPRP